MRNGKRWIALMLALAMCLSVLPANVLATELGSEAETAEVAAPEDTSEATEVEEPQVAETEEPDEEPVEDVSPSTMAATSGTYGSNVKWSLSDSGTLTISGKGKMKDLTRLEKAPWYNYRGKIKAIVIKGGVTSIGSYAFKFCEKATSVIIPNSITRIGDGAFEYCELLEKIEIPSKVNYIGFGAFALCGSLISVEIPDKVTKISDSIFVNCVKLKKVKLSDEATEIGEEAFLGCINLSAVNIPQKAKTINKAAFAGCSNLKSIKISGHVTSIGDSAFSDCSELRSVTLPASVTFIDWWAFYNCSKLRDVYYAGNEDDWNKIDIKIYNGYLAGANIHYNSEGERFDAAVYQAGIRLDRGIEEAQILQESPSQRLYNSGEEVGLTNTTKAWKAITKAADAMDKPSTLLDIPLEKKDMYTAIILSVFEAESKSSGKELVSETQEVSEQLLEYLKMTMKTRHNIQLAKDNDLTKMTRDQQATLFLSTNEWLEKKNGRVSKVLKGLDIAEKALKYAQKFSDWCDYVASANALVSMDCYTKELMSQLYQKASNGDLKWALQDCVTIMQSNEKQLGDLMTAKLAEGIRLSVMQEGIDALWGSVKKLVEKSFPYVGLVLTVCKASYTVSVDANNLLFNTDRVSENFCKMGMLVDMEKILVSVYNDAKKACQTDLSHDNAELFNRAYRLLYNCHDVDCQYAMNFVNAVDEGAISIILRALKIKDREALKAQIKDIREKRMVSYWDDNNLWINSLMEDYPEEYPKYRGGLHETLHPVYVTIGYQKVMYTGGKHKPSVVVKYTGEVLKAGTDYSVSYSNNKNVGTATVTVVGNGIYYGKITKTFDIIPKGVSSVTVSNQKGKKLKVSWNPNKSVNGYEIQYALNKNYQKAKKTTVKKAKETGKVIGGMKKNKKYFVRVRTYQKVSGKNYYSNWSKTKTVTIKK